MKIKTIQLTGAALDWAVAKCEGFSPHIFTEQACGQERVRPLTRWCGVNVGPTGHDVFSPSTAWSDGGPIIDRELIGTGPRPEGSIWPEPWLAASPKDDAMFWGATPLIAAMRCYVASKLGDEVEVPEELV